MTPWQAFFQAAGLASANAQLYVGTAITVLLTIIVQLLSKLYKMELKSPQQKVNLIVSIARIYLDFVTILE